MPAILGDVRKVLRFYLEVDDLNVIKAAVSDAEVYMPERTTFYSSREIGVKDPTGHSSRILRRRLLPDLARVAGLRGLQFEVTGKRPGVKMRFSRQPRGAACRPLY